MIQYGKLYNNEYCRTGMQSGLKYSWRDPVYSSTVENPGVQQRRHNILFYFFEMFELRCLAAHDIN